MSNPEAIRTNQRSASLRQIHTAIDQLHKSEFESAISLASAAEGGLPKTDKPHLFTKLQTLIDSLPADNGASGINDFTNWTKHGTRENSEISELEVIITITRAVSKFAAVYEGLTPKMMDFVSWAIAHEQPDKKSN